MAFIVFPVPVCVCSYDVVTLYVVSFVILQPVALHMVHCFSHLFSTQCYVQLPLSVLFVPLFAFVSGGLLVVAVVALLELFTVVALLLAGLPVVVFWPSALCLP